jgi:DNA-directed RNA polymerase subunit RPC12/RpoP
MNEGESPEETSEVGAGEQEKFPCTRCGARMSWDPAADALSCAYCGSVVQVPRGEGTVVERELSEAGAAARGLGIEVRVAKCQTCGARVSYETSATARQCVYCGSPNVLPQEANRNAIRPESLVPLDVCRKEVEEGFRRWIHGLWFRPNELKRARAFDALGIYVPFWTFDCRVHSDWSADSGTYYYVTVPRTVMVNGRPRVQMVQERRVRWRPAWGSRDDAYDDHLVLASNLAPELVEDLGGFDTRGLVPYRPEYLAGWHAEEYQLDLECAWSLAQEALVASQRARCAGDVPGDTHRNLRVQNRIHDVRWKHVLLPVWSLQYRFGKKTYTVLVNGKTGKVAGKAPISWAKIALLVLAILAAIPIGIGILALFGAR